MVEVKPKKIGSYIKIRKMVANDFFIESKGKKAIVNVIEMIENQILTRRIKATLEVEDGNILANEEIAKVAVVNRRSSKIGKGFVKISIDGAIASSIAHDSHHIIVVGRKEEKMAQAVNSIKNGGIAVVGNEIVKIDLPLAGLMSNEKAGKVARKFKDVVKYANKLGCNEDFFKKIFFLCLLVIPEIRISDKGMFDVRGQRFIDVVENGQVI